MSMNNDFGLVGLAVMGQNLVLNIESRGYAVSVFNRRAQWLPSSWPRTPANACTQPRPWPNSQPACRGHAR